MIRLLIFFAMATVGATLGALIGLVGGAFLLERGAQACATVDCANVLVRNYLPLGAAAGALLGLAKARQLISERA